MLCVCALSTFYGMTDFQEVWDKHLVLGGHTNPIHPTIINYSMADKPVRSNTRLLIL
jgi:hypothetical protein